MAKIKFITDSASDISAELLKELDIEMVSFTIHAGDREFLDRVEMPPQEFYEFLEEYVQEEKTVPTHSQITPFQFSEIFYKAWKDGYTHIIYTSINSMGSATYQNALSQANSFFFDNPAAKGQIELKVIDSKTYSVGYGYAVVEGARMAKAGKEVDEIICFMEDWMKYNKILFVPYSLKFAKKSGRVSATVAFMGEALGLRPILTFEMGESKILAKVRGEKNVVEALVELCDEDRQVGAPYCILRSTMEGYEEDLIEECTETFGDPPAMIAYAGGVIAINAGTEMIGIAYRQEDEEDPVDSWSWDYSKFKK